MPRDGLTLRFAGEILSWRGPSPYHFVPVPAELSMELRAIAPLVSYGWGVIPVRGRIGSTEFTTSLFPRHGGYMVPIKDAVRTREVVGPGDLVEIELTIGG